MKPAPHEATAVWFLKSRALWHVPLHRRGDHLHTGPPRRLASVPYKSGRWLTLTVTRDGRHIAIDDGSSYDENGAGGIWLIPTLPRLTVKKLPRIADPAFSPDGRYLAVTRTRAGSAQDVSVLDTARNRWQTLLTNASQPCWSADGREIALIKDTDDNYGMVLDAQTQRVHFCSPGSVSLTEPRLSPDGRFYAALCAISRPKLGHTIWDRRSGKVVTRSFDWPNRLPAELYGWSPDGNWLACNWRVLNSENDGTWLHDEVGLVSWKPGIVRWIDRGNCAAFSPDNRHLFWLRPTGTLCATTVGPTAAPLQPLLHNVDAFAII